MHLIRHNSLYIDCYAQYIDININFLSIELVIYIKYNDVDQMLLVFNSKYFYNY